MAESSKKTEKYIPNPFEAAALKELHQPWRFYDSKEEFEKVVAEFSKETFQTEVGETNKWDAARANGLITFGAELHNYERGSLDAAESQIRNNKELWKKVQAAHLYNTAGFKPEINLDSGEDISAEDILKRINENLDKLESGKIVDGRYQPSKAERNVLRALGNYGEFIRNPRNEDEIAKFKKDIKRKFSNINKREDYQKFETKSKKKQNKDNRKEKTMSDENTFKLEGEDLEFCTAHGINPEEITSREAFETRKAEIENAENSEEKEDKKDNKKETSEKSEKEDENEENKKKEAIKVHVGEPNAEDKTNDEIPDWVKRKAAYYKGLADKHEITGYKQDTSKQGFAAEFNNAEIHYTSETEVTVSEDAGFEVFDVMLKEEDNKGRPVEFPENASKEVATRMYAACVLNGNPMQGAVPKEIDLEELKKCFPNPKDIEKYNQVKNFYEKSKQQQNNEQQKNGEENSEQKENPEKRKQKIKESLNNAVRLGATPPVHMAGYVVDGTEPIEIKPDEDVKPLTGKEREEFIEKLSTQQLSDVLENAILTKDLANELKQIKETKDLCQTKQNEDFKIAFALGYQPKNADFYKQKLGFTDEEMKPLEGAERRKLIDSLSSERLLIVSKLVNHDLKKELEGICRIKEQVEPLKQDMENAAKLGIAPEKYGAILEDGQLVEIDRPNDIKPLEGEERKAFLESTPIKLLSEALEKTRPLTNPTAEQKVIIEELKQTIATRAIKEQSKAKEELHQMIKDGKVLLAKDEKTGKVEITADNQQDLKKALLLTANIKSAQEAALKANGNNNEQYRQQQIENLRARMSPEQTKAHQDKQDARDLVMAARLGIAPKDTKVTDHKGNEVTAKTGENLNSYQSKLSKETMARLTQKFKGAEK